MPLELELEVRKWIRFQFCSDRKERKVLRPAFPRPLSRLSRPAFPALHPHPAGPPQRYRLQLTYLLLHWAMVTDSVYIIPFASSSIEHFLSFQNTCLSPSSPPASTHVSQPLSNAGFLTTN